MQTNTNPNVIAIKGRYILLTADALTAAAQAHAKLKIWSTFAEMPNVCDLVKVDGTYDGVVAGKVGFDDKALEASGHFVIATEQRDDFEELVREFVPDERNEYAEKLTDVMHEQLRAAGKTLTHDEINALALSILDHEFAIPEANISEHVASKVTP